MINMNGFFCSAYGAYASLSLDHRFYLGGADSVPTTQMVMTTATKESILRFLTARIVTRLAISMPTVFVVAVVGELA